MNLPAPRRITERTLILAVLPILLAAPALLPPAYGQTNAIDFSRPLQRIDGFGIAEPFQRIPIMRGSQGLTPQNQQLLIDLLFNPATGLGVNILRIGINTDSNIEPASPGSPTATPQYVWDDSDGGQLWLAQQAQSYGVTHFYADAWSAPGFMKTNGSPDNGGAICGLQGTVCLDGEGANPQTATPAVGDDWRQAYADYLIQFLADYQQSGVPITEIGFTNEPDLSTSYDSMQLSSGQVIDFLKVFGPMLQASGLPASLVCCDLSNWSKASSYTSAVAADPVAASYVHIYSGHEYGVSATQPLPAPARSTTWMSEWSPNGSTWNPNWDSGDGTDTGLVLANDISQALTAGNVNAYVYWYGASTSTTRAFIQMNGPDLNISKRYYAMAAWSRFVHANAFRVTASAADSGLAISAFRNADQSAVINIINNADTTVAESFPINGIPVSYQMTAYLTDEADSLAHANGAQFEPAAAASSGGTATSSVLSVTLPPRSLTTIILATPGS